MRKSSWGSARILCVAAVIAAAGLLPLRAVAADSCTGTVAYQGKAMKVAYVYLVKGTDYASNGIRELVFSPTDIGAKIKACASLSCVSSGLGEGMTVDFDAGPRLNYWIVANGQRVQYSGTAEPSAFTATADQPDHLAGTLRIDDATAGGGTVDVTFDASLTKAFGAAP